MDQGKSESLHEFIRKEVEIQTKKEVEIQTRKNSERLDELNNTINIQAKEIRKLEEVRRTKLCMMHMMNEFKLLYGKYNQMTITVRPRTRISKCQDPSVLHESAF